MNVPALEATFGFVDCMAQGKNGDLYVVPNINHVVLKLEFNSTEGTWSNVEVIAGTGSSGKGADDILGTDSSLSYPTGLALIENLNGNVTAILIADMNNNRIRKLDMSTRVITTIAGTGALGFSGDGASATGAELNHPFSAYYDKSNGDIYIADTYNNRIRRMRNGTISTVVGKDCTSSDGLGDGGPATDACLYSPYQITMNKAGEWFIADYVNDRIRKVDMNGTITTVAGGGTETVDALATSTKLSNPNSVAFTPSGEMFVADNDGSVIRKMDNSGFMRVIAGGGSQTPSSTNPIRSKSASIKPSAIIYASDGSDAIFFGDFGHIYKLFLFECFGVMGTKACSGNGTCVQTDQCECDDGWTGSDCSLLTCFGIARNVASVCSGHGSCIGIDECQCDSGWMGVDCSITYCFGVTSNLPDRVCSGKGQCVRPNKCHCDRGRIGHKCHIPYLER